MVKTIVAAVVAVMFAASAHAQTQPAQTQPASPQPPPACAGPAHRAFDFWLGEWDAYVSGTQTLAGRSVIEAKDAGCVITEQWTSQRAAYSGRSLNLYDQTTGRWLQFWVDSGGEITRFEGGPTPTGMQFLAPDEAAPGREGKQTLRMTFTRNPDGSVRQHGEVSGDGGRTWTTSYDFHYRRRPPG
jgi:hypothetical protein